MIRKNNIKGSSILEHNIKGHNILGFIIAVLCAAAFSPVSAFAVTAEPAAPSIIYAAETAAENADAGNGDTTAEDADAGKAETSAENANAGKAETSAENANAAPAMIYAAGTEAAGNGLDASGTDAPGEAANETNEAAAESKNSLTGDDIISFARQFVGNRYRYGGTSLTGGIDCSGFTMAVYNHFGISLPHSSSSQRSAGSSVGSLSEAQPGDLVCYSGHVALYMGNGQIVHAQNARNGITISNANYNRILSIRRLL